MPIVAYSLLGPDTSQIEIAVSQVTTGGLKLIESHTGILYIFEF